MLDHPAASPPSNTSPLLRTTRSVAKTQQTTKEPTPEPPKLQPTPPSPTPVSDADLDTSSAAVQQSDIERSQPEGLAATEGEGRVNGTGSALSNSDSPAGDAAPLAAVPHTEQDPAPPEATPNDPSEVILEEANAESTAAAPPPAVSSPSSPSHSGQPTQAPQPVPSLEGPTPAEDSKTSPGPKHLPDQVSSTDAASEGPATDSPAQDNLLDGPSTVADTSGSPDHNAVGGDQPGSITAEAEVPVNGELPTRASEEPSPKSSLSPEKLDPASAEKPPTSPDPSAPIAAAVAEAASENVKPSKEAMDLQYHGPMDSMDDGSGFFNPQGMVMMQDSRSMSGSNSGQPYLGSDLSMVPDLSDSAESYMHGMADQSLNAPDNVTVQSSSFISDPSSHLPNHSIPDGAEPNMDFSINETTDPSSIPTPMPPEPSESKPPDSVGPSNFDASNPPPETAQVSPSWAPTVLSDGDTTMNGSTTATLAASGSPSTNNASGSQNESRPPTATDGASDAVNPAVSPTVTVPEAIGGGGQEGRASSVKINTTEAPGLSSSLSVGTAQSTSPNIASNAINGDVADVKVGSPASVKMGDMPGAAPGDPKVGLVLALNEQLIRICVAYTSGATGTVLSQEADQFQTRLSSNLNWLASVADTNANHLKPNSQFPLPILQPPKPVTTSLVAAQCADALGKLSVMYARMQELFKVDYERKIKRETKMRMRQHAAAAAAANGMGTPMHPPGAALPVAGVKRERDAEADTGDRKRMAVGATNSMEAAVNGGSPTRPSVVRAGSLALSQTQSPVMANQSPVVSTQVASAMSTPRMSSGFAPQSMGMQQRSSVGGVGSNFGLPQTSPVSSVPPQQQRQPSLPPHSQHSPTHQQQMQSQFAQPGQPPIMPQTTGGSVPSPQRPPSVTQNPTPFQQAQPSFQAPGMISRAQQSMAGPMGMNGAGRPPVPDDQRTQMQLRQHMASQQGPSQVSPTQAQGPSQSQPQMQPMGGMQQTGNGAMTNGGPMHSNQANIQMIVQNLQNPQNALTQHLHRTIPNFAALPLQTQVQQFHAHHTRILQQQQLQRQQQQQNLAAGAIAGNANLNAVGPNVRPPSAAGGMAGNMSTLGNMRQGTASPRIPGTVPNGGQAMATPMPLQRQVSGQQQPLSQQQAQQQMTMSPNVPPLGLGQPGMTPQQRQMMMMMQQQQASLNSMMPPSNQQSVGGSPSAFGQAPRVGMGHGMTPSGLMGRVASGGSFGQTSQSHGPGMGGVGGPATGVQQVPQTHGQWAGAGTPGGYVSSPLNPGWSPQTAGGPGMAGASPVSSGGVNAGGSAFHIGASPAPHSEAGATPRHSGATPQSGMGFDNGSIGGGAMGGGGEYDGGDPSALFNESWAGNGL